MNSLSERIMEYVEAEPEATPIQAEDLLHLVDRAAVARALAALSEFWDETIVPNGGDAANWLGLTTQNTVRSVYLTSGSDRLLHFGAHRVELRHTPASQLLVPHRTAGVIIRALAWLGPNELEESLDAMLPKLSGKELSDLAAARRALPAWMAEPIGRRLVHG